MTSSILHGIDTRLPNLVDLKINFCLIYVDKIARQQKFEKDVLHLSGLRHLRRLHCLSPYTMHQLSMCELIDKFADNNLPIEDLQTDGCNPQIVKSVARLKNIQILYLYEFSYALVVELIEKLPAMEHLSLIQCKDVSVNGIKRILTQAPNLKSLTIRDDEMLLDSDELIQSILNVIVGRVHVKISINDVNNFYPDLLGDQWLPGDTDWLKLYDF